MQGTGDGSPTPALPVRSTAKVIPIYAPEVSVLTPLVHRAGRAPTQATMAKWLKAMKAAGIPQAWAHYPDGTRLEFRAKAEEAEGDTWDDVA